MADQVVHLEGDPPLPLKAVDNGDGTFALAVTTAAGGATNQMVRLAGDPALPFRAVANGDGTFSLAVSGLGGSERYPIAICFDGGGAVLAAGAEVDVVVERAGTITVGRLLADQAGAAVVEVWKAAEGAYPPVSAGTITGAAPLTLSAASYVKDEALTGWTTAVAPGDVLRFHLVSAATVTRLTAELGVQAS